MPDVPTQKTPRRPSLKRVKLADASARWVITVGGLGVIAAVLGICVYLFYVALPMFKGGSRPEQIHAGAVGPFISHTPTANSGTAGASETLPEPETFVAVDEYRTSFVILRPDASIELVHPSSGKAAGAWRLREGEAATSTSFDPASGLYAIGLEDGRVRLGRVRFQSDLVESAGLDARVLALAVDASTALSADELTNLGQVAGAGAQPIGGVYERVSPAQIRRTLAVVEMREPALLIDDGISSPVIAIDHRKRGDRDFLAAVRADSAVAVREVRTTRPLGGGPPRVRLASVPFNFSPPERTQRDDVPSGASTAPGRIYITGDGRHVLLLWSDGTMQRYAPSVASPAAAADAATEPGFELMETLRGLEPEAGGVAHAGMVWGAQTLLIAGAKNSLAGFAVGRDAESGAADGQRVVRTRLFRESASDSVSAIGISLRDRTFVVGDSRGGLEIRNLTSQKVVSRIAAFDNSTVIAATLTPKLDGVLALAADGRFRLWDMSIGHSDVSLSMLFGRTMFEGMVAPGFVYQSSAGEGTPEPKISLIPLIFGTLKGTVAAMLFAVPLAVLAAIYTSEFMRPRMRRVVKPAIEMMASLPSVVLGFVAAIVLAPVLQQNLVSVILAVFALPLGALVGAALWQMFPERMTRRLSGGKLLLTVGVVIALGAGAAATIAPAIEGVLFTPTVNDRLVAAGSFEPVPGDQWPRWVGRRESMSPDVERRLRADGLYFRGGQVVKPVPAASTPPQQPGDLRRWLDGVHGTARAGWTLILWPIAAALAWVVIARVRAGAHEGSRLRLGAIELAIYAVAVAVGLLIAMLAGAALQSAGFDPRDSILGPFSLRNTLLVGFIMGFAIIPIIYTISEDAMRSVPETLRTASIGAGATPWQTAIRVVLPAAGSGVFSACMIGLGRAVGETMIVLMASGGTPEISANIFSGFRSLAANIATELPDSAQGSSQYRVLFLCGLTLFVMTFIINTTAEVIRQRYRKKTASL
jgi:phosphate transport system permease protein